MVRGDKKLANENNTVKISVRLTQTEKDELQNFAQAQDLTMSQVIRKALKEYMNKTKRI